jgi:pSer/pThr/pTyr-binding forkhead associated (FHA) protein
MRRFAVGVIKVVEPPNHPEAGKVYFIPMNARVTVGRSEDNDIVLSDKNDWLSRWHCGLIADQNSVWIDDFISKNGTKIGSERISTPYLLKTGDEIVLGPFKLRFQKIQENTILSQ